MELQDNQIFQSRIDNKGYIEIKVNGEWIKQHKYVVQRYLNRELTKDEVIHHIDFNRKNNEIDNLVIFPSIEEHSHFHRQIRQFGMTRPRMTKIKLLKEKMQNEKNKKQI
jgi:hypothetical protein